jgi:hypothetical protein
VAIHESIKEDLATFPKAAKISFRPKFIFQMTGSGVEIEAIQCRLHKYKNDEWKLHEPIRKKRW